MATIPFIQGQSRKLAKLTIISTPSSMKGGIGSAIGQIAGAVGLGAASSLGSLLGLTPLVFEAMYNPTSFSQKYGAEILEKPTTRKAAGELEFMRLQNQTVSFKLIIDGTGASPGSNLVGANSTSLLASATKGVDLVVEYLLKGVLALNKETHDTNELTLIWGVYKMKAKVTSVSVNYIMFDRIGRPLRAEVDISFKQISDVSLLSMFKSPDVTKTYIVKAGDTLPLIALREYDDESFYLEIAKINNLKNYRRLEPGMTLVMPPFNKNAEETNA